LVEDRTTIWNFGNQNIRRFWRYSLDVAYQSSSIVVQPQDSRHDFGRRL